eukprot:SAG31_NODE_16641_length_701_cov_1.911960_1_plen_87_part_00
MFSWIRSPGSEWNFTRRLRVRRSVDDGPLVAGGALANLAGGSDFFGNPRHTSTRSDGRIAQAGPFENVAGHTQEFEVWPPHEYDAL